MIKRNGRLIADRLVESMKLENLDYLILSSEGSITYATGYYNNYDFRGNLVLITAGGTIYYIVNQFLREAVLEIVDESVTVIDYPVAIYIEDYIQKDKKQSHQDQLTPIKIASDYIKGNQIRIGIEPTSLNVIQYEYLIKRFGKSALVSADMALANAKKIKTPYEIDVLRRNAQVTQYAMQSIAKNIVAGMDIKTIYSMFARYIMNEEPCINGIAHYHTIGDHFSPTSMPGDFKIKNGDLIRLDGGGILRGYNSDIARTFAVGDSISFDKQKIFDALFDGHQYQIDHIKPGVKMKDVFRGTDSAIKAHSYMVDYGYNRGNYGHSLGCSTLGNEEYPFIAEDEESVFEPGMVMCIETPFYSSRHQTYNIEDTLLITEKGIELFTEAPRTLFY